MTAKNSQARILRVLAAAPGANTRHVARTLELDESTASYHLRRLSKQGHVASERRGREVVWFMGQMRLCPILRAAMPIMRRPTVTQLAHTLDERARTIPELAQKSGLTLGETRWAADTLADAGILKRTPGGLSRLAPGAAWCIMKAMRGESCDRWGACEPSREAAAASASSASVANRR